MTTVTPVHGAAGDHQHETSLDDTFEFLNTIELESGSLLDHFGSLDDAIRWFDGRGILHGEVAGDRGERARARDLARIKAVREALRDVAHAVAEHRPANPKSLAEVNRAIAARERVELVQEPDGVSVGHSHIGDPLDDVLARLADPLVAEIQAGNADRVKICANDTCRWVFYDESRAGRRRWCDMATCGNRAKAARHRAKLKMREIAGADGEPPADASGLA